MENILVLNIGSSSIKYDVYHNERHILEGMLERVKDFEKGLKSIIKKLEKESINIDAIGHRVVHGKNISEPTLITPLILRKLEKISILAPLHNIPELKGIRVCLKLFKRKGRSLPNVAVFDTAFHTTIPPRASIYAIPKSLTKKYSIKRYGFHGTSHKYVAHQAAHVLKRPVDKLKLITCHLGNGCSISAIDRGFSIDTSMGFTPLEGLVMGTRSGDLDPAIVTFLAKAEHLNPKKLDELLNKKSGLKGLCKFNDMRDIRKKRQTNLDAHLAYEVYCYRIIKYIGAYAAAMNGVDAIVFTAGIGEHAFYVRERVLSHFKFLGLKLDNKKNKNNEVIISAPKSKIKALVIPTDEELMIVREVRSVLEE